MSDNGKTYITQNAAGCDSVVTLELVLTDVIRTEERVTVCESAFPIVWNGVEIADASGDGTEVTLTSAALCDSVVTLVLTVNAPSAYTDVVQKCANALPFDWNGYTISGMSDNGKTYITQNAAGCDSIVTLELSLQSAVEEWEEAVITSLDTYLWHDSILLSDAGDYFDTAYYASGCDSVYYTLHLQVFNPKLDVHLSVADVCSDDTELPLHVETLGGKPQRCDILFDEAAKGQGFRDTMNILFPEAADAEFYLPIPHNADTLQYVRPNDYTLTLRITDIFSQTTLHTVSFTVLYPSWLIMQRWNDVLMMQNERYNGGYTFSGIRWYHDGEQIESRGENEGYIYVGNTDDTQTLAYGTPYYAVLTRTDDGKTFRTCDFYPVPQNSATNLKSLTLSPRRKGEYRLVRINTNCSGRYIVYGVDGKQLGQGRFGEEYASPDLMFDSSVAAGTYIIRFQANDGSMFVRKWIVR